MALNLLSLLGQQALSPLYETPEGTVDTRTIGVEGNVPAASVPAEIASPASVQPSVDLSGVRGPQLSAEEYAKYLPFENLPQRKGMFGVKGTLRDVLGAVGDAFLIQSGSNPIYSQKRDQEQLSDAMIGFSSNPLEAIRRVSQIDPAAAQKMYENWQDRNYQDQVLEQKAASAEATVDKNAVANYGKGAGLFGTIMGAATPETYSQVIPLLNRVKERYGLGDEFLVPDAYDEDLARTYQYGGMTAQQQVEVPFKERRLDIQQQNADTSATRAARPPQARAATTNETAIRIGNKPESERTPGEQAWYDNWQSKNTGRRGSGRRTSSATPSTPATRSGGKLIFRNGKLVAQ